MRTGVYDTRVTRKHVQKRDWPCTFGTASRGAGTLLDPLRGLPPLSRSLIATQLVAPEAKRGGRRQVQHRTGPAVVVVVAAAPSNAGAEGGSRERISELGCRNLLRPTYHRRCRPSQASFIRCGPRSHLALLFGRFSSTGRLHIPHKMHKIERRRALESHDTGRAGSPTGGSLKVGEQLLARG